MVFNVKFNFLSYLTHNDNIPFSWNFQALPIAGERPYSLPSVLVGVFVSQIHLKLQSRAIFQPFQCYKCDATHQSLLEVIIVGCVL